MTDRCSSCKKQSASLSATASKIVAGQAWMLCATCRTAGFEPRFAIILVGQRDGEEAVEDFIKYRRYFGDVILSEDLLI